MSRPASGRSASAPRVLSVHEWKPRVPAESLSAWSRQVVALCAEPLAERLRKGLPALPHPSGPVDGNVARYFSRVDGWPDGFELPVSTPVAVCVAALAVGEVAALPTDTLYGLAVDASSSEAVTKVYAIKGRDRRNPLAITVADPRSIPLYGECSHIPADLLSKLMSSTYTVILRRPPGLLDTLNPGFDTIGVRAPTSPFLRQVSAGLEATQAVSLFYGLFPADRANPTSVTGAIALTSCNLSSEPPALAVDEFRHLWPWLSVVADVGRCSSSRLGSTILNMTSSDGPSTYRVIRPGQALAELRAMLAAYGWTEVSN